MAEKRVSALTQATEFADDDYLLIDSESLGTRKISKDILADQMSVTDDGQGNITITIG